MNNENYNGEEHHQPSHVAGDYNLPTLFHGLNLGHHVNSGPSNAAPRPEFPPDLYTLGTVHRPQMHVQPILDLADSAVLAHKMPLSDDMVRPQVASFPHHQAAFPQYPGYLNADVLHGNEFSSMNYPASMGFVEGGVGQRNMGWGGQAIEDTQNGSKGPWFGKSMMHERNGFNGGSMNGNNRRGRSRGKSNGRGGPRNYGRGRSGYDSRGSDSAVESIVRSISQIPHGQKIDQNVYQSIHILDSREMASLLKELSCRGLPTRAVELFDTIRSYDRTNPISIALLDVFTYTASISLCISTHDVDRALRLAAEMKFNKIQCNVHTYTALMNVCIKCSRYGTALETYETMRRDGCIPNVVTFNTLIDVYGKTGAWEQALRVLDIMRAEGVDPVLRTYNTLLIACNMCNQPREAIATYKRMLDEGFSPNSTTYNALISAYGKSGQLQKVMEVFQEMTNRGCERNVITFSSLISACEKAGQWELALELFQEMARERCNPNTVTFNSLITALGQGGQWEKAKQIFDQMKSRNCIPDVVTYTALISAMEKGGQWRLALDAFLQMKRQGCKADAIVYNAVVNALWDTGIIWAQRKSLVLFKTALSEGHFPQQSLIPGLVRAEVNLHATTSGVAMLSLYVWLMKLKRFVDENGVDAVPSRITIVTDRGRGAREQGNSIVKEAVNAIMSKWESPFVLREQRAYSGNPLLEASGRDVATWIQSEIFTAKLFSVFPCADILPGENYKGMSAHDISTLTSSKIDDPDNQRDIKTEESCIAAFKAVQHFEQTHCLVLQNMGYAYLQQRAELIKNCSKMNKILGGPEEVVHDSVLLMDRVMSTTLNFAQEVLELLSAACVAIAFNHTTNSSTKEEKDFEIFEKASGLPAWAIKQMEWSICQVLNQDTASVSSIRCVKLLVERLGVQYLPEKAADAILGDSIGLCLECASDTALMNCRPSIAAAAVIYAERRERGAIPFWPAALSKLTGYNDISELELSVAIKVTQRICTARNEILRSASVSSLEDSDIRSGSLSSSGLFSNLDGIDESLRAYSPHIADIPVGTQAILQSICDTISNNPGPITPEETEASVQGGSSGDQSGSNGSNGNSSSSHSSEDGKTKVEF